MNQKYIQELFELLAIPSISAQSEHKKDMDTACQWLKNRLEKLSFKADILPTNGHPVVYAENLQAGEDKPTVLIYGHYDVQDPGNFDEWSSDPFKPEIRSGNIYGRGTADDKGQFYTWIAAIDQLGEVPVNIKFLLEGEEEMGSRNIKDFIEDNKALLSADVCVISDSHAFSENQPMICYGLRGLCYTQITVKTMPKDVHSGTYGGNVPNPAYVLSSIISKLKDKNNKITVPGFFDDVRVLETKEKQALQKFPFQENEILAESGAKEVLGEKGISIPERAGARPTLEINGIWGGYTGEGEKTIIPASASAKISMRLVPHQIPAKIFEQFRDYVISLCPSYADVEVELLSTADPVIMNKNSKYFEAAEKAYKKTFGNVPLYELSGGTIGAAAVMKHSLGLDSILMGYGLPDDGLHSPNEKLAVAMFSKGIETNMVFLKWLGSKSMDNL